MITSRNRCRQCPLQSPVGVEGAGRCAQAEQPTKFLPDVSHRRSGAEVGAHVVGFGTVGDRLVDGEGLAGPRRAVDGAHRDRFADVADQVTGIEQVLGGQDRRTVE